jgi:hypothetical protein
VSQEALEAAFVSFGQFETFVLHRNRVAFIEWKEVKHAEAARSALNKAYGVGVRIVCEHVCRARLHLSHWGNFET